MNKKNKVNIIQAKSPVSELGYTDLEIAKKVFFEECAKLPESVLLYKKGECYFIDVSPKPQQPAKDFESVMAEVGQILEDMKSKNSQALMEYREDEDDILEFTNHNYQKGQ